VTLRPASTNVTLNKDLGALGLSWFWRFEGDQKYAVEMPAPTVTDHADSSITLTWATLPAGCANSFFFTGTTDGGDGLTPANHDLISATLRSDQACQP